MRAGASVCLAVVILTSCRSEVAQTDPCNVLKDDEVERLVGAPFHDALRTGTGEGCSYGDRKNDAATTLLVNIVPKDDQKKFREKRAVAGQTAHVNDLDAIGDEAFAYGNTETRLQSAEARKGTHRVRVLMEGPSATQARAVEALRLAVKRV